MADPLSIASSVIATAETARKLQHALDSIHAKQPKRSDWPFDRIERRIAMFGSILDVLVGVLTSDHEVVSARLYSDLQATLEVSSDCMQKINDILQRPSKSRLKQALLTPRFMEEELDVCDRSLESSLQMLQLTIQVISLAKKQKGERARIPPIAPIQPANADGSPYQASPFPIRTPITGAENQSPPPEETLLTDEDTVNDYLKRIGYKHQRYFNKLNFEELTAYQISIHDDNTITRGVPPIKTLDSELLVAAGPSIRVIPPWSALARKELTLILCEATTATSSSVPFRKEVFVKMMKYLGIPPGLFQALFTGTPKSVYYAAGHLHQAGFVLRAPMSGSENWTLAISWNAGLQVLGGFIHGLQRHEMDKIAMHIDDSRSELAHPMNIPLILCEMLIESDSNGVKGRASDLYQVELRTNYHGYPRTDTAGTSDLSKSPEQDFETITRSLNIIISRLAFHEMRIHANAVFADQISERIRLMNQHIKGPLFEQNGKAAKGDYRRWAGHFESMSQCLLERLNHLRTEQSALLLEISCNQKIAQSQLDIVYNLVAQRDNKANLTMAAISTDIANTTKDDSFAMRTIAIMSIAFLPGTFVASFFSMDMFDWQAPKGATVVSFRFWIYWALTAPLTFVVFCIWYFWLRTHKKHDDQRQKRYLDPRIHEISGPQMMSQVSKKRLSYWKTKWAKARQNDVEKLQAEDAQLGTSTIPAVRPESELRNRAPITQVTRADTIVRGPPR